MEKKKNRINNLTLAFGIAFMPPIWAVLAPYIGVTTGAVALICAGLFAANGNNRAHAGKIMVGFLLGDLWATAAVWIMAKLSWNTNVELYVTLFVMGGLAVMIGESFPQWIFTPSWLCGWAIGLMIMGPLPAAELGSIPFQIGAAMIVGILYVGVGVDIVQKWILKKLNKGDPA